MSYDEELIEAIIHTSFEIIDNDSFVDLLETNFPFGNSSINWSEVTGSICKQINLTTDKATAKKEVLNFIGLVKEKINIRDTDSIIILSDGSLENIYSLKWCDFIQYFEHILFLPQHTYIIPKTGTWCLNYTFEDDLFFSFSTKMG